MLSIRRAARAFPIIAAILASAMLLHPALTAEAPRTDGIAALAARTPTLVGRDLPVAASDKAGALLLCAGGSTDRCFETSGIIRTVNVGVFFDRRRPVAETHFFLKYFDPPDGRVRIDGFSFQANRAGVRFPSCGVVRTSRETPTFPRTEQLTTLQELDIVSANPGLPTCVDLASRNFVLEANEAAWIVLQFPAEADTTFIGVAADADAVDHPCDFFTRDTGEQWYRPDPQQSPLDWTFTVHYGTAAAKARRRVPWSLVKGLHQ